jgi:transcriptional regulator with XRE-family HTH domain
MMLKNEQQLAGARKKLRALEAALERESDPDGRRSLGHLIGDVRKEISEYEAVRDGAVRTFAIRSLDDLGPALIKVRLASGKTQRELAAELEVSEQQVSKDESREYETAGVAKLADVLDVLDYELVGEIRPKTEMDAEYRPVHHSGVDAPSDLLPHALAVVDVDALLPVAVMEGRGAFNVLKAVLTASSGIQTSVILNASCLQGPWKVERTVPHDKSFTTSVIQASRQEAKSAH